ncbi:MAG: hypothetical protein BM564_03635 [Bacteroidetes bacterium MedPE-SWsnd-G2]|nr:MAG: hypothetical protein BM564_03635 [Bacteroidetes bacterium MedPE-SWsnd-G2]
MDGTNNTTKDNTNIYKLYNLVTPKKNVSSFYTVGVGAGPDFKFLGLAFGFGLEYDVIEAYQYICNNYSPDEKTEVFIFGFSRGAYTAKVLTNLIYTAGIRDLSQLSAKQQRKFIKQLYKAYLGPKPMDIIEIDTDVVVLKWERRLRISIPKRSYNNIEVLGLFDTVEALDKPNFEEIICSPNWDHLEQFKNVNHVLHAASLDDNRADLFTPSLASCPDILLEDHQDLNKTVNEVWFSGAHSDIGGGYQDHTEINTISLNWFLKHLKSYNLFKSNNFDKASYDAPIHDAQLGYKRLYDRKNRSIVDYYNQTKAYNNGRLKLHESVIHRMERGQIPNFKLSALDSIHWFDKAPFNKCFEKRDSLRIYKPETCEVLEIVN